MLAFHIDISMPADRVRAMDETLFDAADQVRCRVRELCSKYKLNLVMESGNAFLAVRSMSIPAESQDELTRQIFLAARAVFQTSHGDGLGIRIHIDAGRTEKMLSPVQWLPKNSKAGVFFMAEPATQRACLV